MKIIFGGDNRIFLNFGHFKGQSFLTGAPQFNVIILNVTTSLVLFILCAEFNWVYCFLREMAYLPVCSKKSEKIAFWLLLYQFLAWNECMVVTLNLANLVHIDIYGLPWVVAIKVKYLSYLMVMVCFFWVQLNSENGFF